MLFNFMKMAGVKHKIKPTEISTDIKKKITKVVTKLDDKFFNQESTKFAQALLGSILTRSIDNKELHCKIVEVECYFGLEDKSSHSHNLKQTARNEAMFMAPGTLYVYMTYGMYNCMNISSKGDGNAVLIRAAEPLSNIQSFIKNRSKGKTKLNHKNVCNGPAKLCQALNITREMDKTDLTKSMDIYLSKGEEIPQSQIVRCERIGLNEKRCGEWAHKPYRYYITGNEFVSKRNKIAEEKLLHKGS